jgi:uncharacterized damage-inducible protein DinB
MSMKQAFIGEFNHEMAGTRRMLERLPEGKSDWTPHQKSMTMGRLAGHLAEIPAWVMPTLTQDSLNLQTEYKPVIAETSEQILAVFDANVNAAREALAAAPDEDLMKPWSLMAGEHTIFTLPKAAVLRSFVMSHLIHHRAQLTVYYRLNDVPVPALYGPSADERQMAAGA